MESETRDISDKALQVVSELLYQMAISPLAFIYLFFHPSKQPSPPPFLPTGPEINFRAGTGPSYQEIGCGTLAHEGLMPVVSEEKHLGGLHERDHVIRCVAIGCQRWKLRVCQRATKIRLR